MKRPLSLIEMAARLYMAAALLVAVVIGAVVVFPLWFVFLVLSALRRL